MTDENLEVVSMLPDINAKKRYKASGGLQRVLKIQGHWTWHFFNIKVEPGWHRQQSEASQLPCYIQANPTQSPESFPELR